MKILHINCNYAGTALHKHMVEHLNVCGDPKDKIKSCVYVPVCQGKDVEVQTAGTRVVLSRCFRKWHRFFFDYKQSRIIRDVLRECDVPRYDCIHAYTLFADGNTARRLSRKYHIPYVTAVRNTDLSPFFEKAFYLRRRGVKILRDASAVFFLSENYRSAVLEGYVPEKLRKEILDKSYIIPNGIDDFWLENRYTDRLRTMDKTRETIRKKQLKVIYVGCISGRKNPLATQEALQLLRQRGWKVSFTAVGKIEDEKLYEQMISYPDTRYFPQQPKERLIDYYRENDLFVMPSHVENFGRVYSEAMSQGLPVIYTRGQGFDGQFPDGEVGFAVDDENPADIADKIELAAAQYDRLVENGLQFVRRFNWTDICEKYRGIYENLIK